MLGTVTGTGLDNYAISVKQGEVSYASETGTSNIEDGELVSLDFTTMKDGQYTIYLTATGTDDSTQTVTETFTLDHPKAIYSLSSADTVASQNSEASYGYYILKSVNEIGAYAEKDGVVYPINSTMATGASTSTVNYYWNSTHPDGQSEGGDLVPDGDYEIYIVTTSGGVATTSISIPMRVDNTADEPASFGTTGEITYANANSFDATASFLSSCQGTTVWISIMNGQETIRSQTDTVDANGDAQVAFTNTGTLSGSGTFTLKVDTTDLAGNTLTTSTSITIDTKAPAPSILADYNPDTGEVTLSWSNSDSDIDGYDIYEGTSLDGLQIRETYYQPATATGEITYSYSESTSGTHYYKVVPISVRYDVSGEEGYESNTVSVSVVTGQPYFDGVQQTYTETSDGAGNWAAYGLQLPVEMNGYATDSVMVEIRNEYTDDTTLAMISGTEGVYYAQPLENLRVGSYEAGLYLYTELQEPVSTANFTIVNNDHPVIYDRNLKNLAVGMTNVDVNFVYSGPWGENTSLSMTGGDLSTSQTDVNINMPDAGISLNIDSGGLVNDATYTFSFASPANVEFLNGTDTVTATSDPILSGNSNPWAVPAGQSIQPPISVEMLNPDGFTTISGSMKILDYNDTVVASTTTLETESDLEEGTIDITGNFDPTTFIAGNYTIKLYTGEEEVPAIYNPSLEARAEATVTDAEITSDGTNFYLKLSGFGFDSLDWSTVTLDLSCTTYEDVTTTTSFASGQLTTESFMVQADLGTTTPSSGYYTATLYNNTNPICNSIDFELEGEVPVQEEDTTAPGVDLTTPSDGETEVDLDRLISIYFDEDIEAGGNTENVYLEYQMETETGVFTTQSATITAIVDGTRNALDITPDQNLMPMTEYTITILTWVVQDTSDNHNANAEISFSFQTGDGTDPGEGDMMPVNILAYGEGGYWECPNVFEDEDVDGALNFAVIEPGPGFWSPDGSINYEIFGMDNMTDTPDLTGSANLSYITDYSYDEGMTFTSADGFEVSTNMTVLPPDVYEIEIYTGEETTPSAMGMFSVVEEFDIGPFASGESITLTTVDAACTGYSLVDENNQQSEPATGVATNGTVALGVLEDSEYTLFVADEMDLIHEAYWFMVGEESTPSSFVSPFDLELYGWDGNDGTDLSTQPVIDFTTTSAEMGQEITIPVGMYYWYNGGGMDFDIVPDGENGAITIGDSTLTTDGYTVYADLSALGGGTVDASYDGTENAWEFMIDINGYTDVGPVQIPVYCQTPGGTMLVAQLVAVMNIDPADMDDTLNPTSTTAWNTLTDFTSIPALTFDKYSTSGGGVYADEAHIATLTLGNEQNTINLCTLDQSGNPVGVMSLISLADNMTLTPGAVGVDTDALEAFDKPAGITMYNLPFAEVASTDMLYTANDGTTGSATEYITSFTYTPPTAYGENNGVLVMSVNGFSTYSIEGLEPWTDSANPVVSISADIVEDGAFASVTPVAVTITVTDEGGSGIASVSGVEGFAVTSSTAYYKEYTTSCAADGAYSYSATATDGALNTESGSFGFTIDTTMPTITVEGVSDGQVTANDLTITFSFTDDNLLTTSASLSGSAVASPLNVTEDGEYTLTLTAEDAAGNISQEIISFTRDSSAPSISITGVTDGAYYKTDVTPTATVTDSVSTTILLNGSAYVSGTTISEEGEYTLSVAAENAAGTQSGDQVTFTIDKTAPTVIISRDPSTDDGINDWYVTRPTITITTNEEAEISYTVGAGDAASYSEPFVIEEDGTFTINATATDLAGNTGTASSVGYKVDTIFPVVAMEALPGITSSSSLTVNGTATDTNPVSMQVFVNGTGGDISIISSGNYSTTVTLTSQGANEIYVLIKDKAGNVTTTSAQTVIFDSVAPTGNVSYDITGLTKEDVTATLTTSDASDVTITNNGGLSTFEFTTNESFTFEFVDAAGNTGSAVATVYWIDKEAPAAPTITAVPDTTTGGSVTVSLTGIEDGANAYISTGGEFAVYASPIAIETNNTTVTAYQVDEAENQSDDATLLINWIDKEAPVITLNGDASTTAEALSTYVDAGATATDAVDGPVAVTSESSVTTSALGTYTVTYIAVDSSGNTATATRTVQVVDTTAPEISINGAEMVTVEALETYTDLGANAADSLEGEIAVTSESSVTTSALGTYTVTYTAVDSSGNTATATRTVQVVDTTAPEISINGADTVTVEALETYTDLGATAADSLDGEIVVTSESSVNTSALGTYTVTYSAVDSSGNEAVRVARTVEVVDTTAPEISITGDNPASVELGSVYTDAGATAEDALEGTLAVTSESSVDTTVIGTYTVTYSAVDSSGNNAMETRTVIVDDTTAPTGTVAYDITGPTKENVTATLTTSDEDDVTITNNEGLSTYNFTTNGSFTFTFADASGNTGSAVATVANIDKTAPIGTVTYSTEVATNGAVTATLATSEVVTITNNEGSNTFEFTSNGSFTFEFADAAGNTGSTVAVVTWIDITAPIATIVSDPESADGEGGWYMTSPTITLSSNEGGEIYYTIESGETDNLYSEPFALEDGTTTLTAWAVDQVGNTSDQVTETYKVDTSAPIISIGNLPDYVKNASFTVSGLYSEANLDALGVFLNGTPVSASTEGSGFSAELTLAEGANTIYAEATDLAGHITTTSAQTVVLDTMAPAIYGLSVNADGTGATVTASTEANLDGITLEVDGSYTTHTYEGGNVSAVLTGLADGDHEIVLTVTDRAGNTASSSATFTVDTIAPVIRAQITEPSGGLPDGYGGWYVTSPKVSLINGESLTMYYNINGTIGESGIAYTSAVTISDGTNQTFNYWADDAAGNRASGSLTFAKVDTQAPDAPTINAPGSVNEITVTVTGTAVGASTIEIGDTNLGDHLSTQVLDGEYSAQIRIMSEGQNTIYAYAFDEAGNMSSMATKIVTKDTKGPNLAIAMANGEGRAIITVAASEAVQTTPSVTVLVDGAVPDGLTVTADGSTGNTYTYIVNQELSGNILIEASATDAAGNEGFGSYAISILDTATDNNVDLGDGAEITFPVGAINDGTDTSIFTAWRGSIDSQPLGGTEPVGAPFEFQINGGGYEFAHPVVLGIPVDGEYGLFGFLATGDRRELILDGEYSEGIFGIELPHFSTVAVAKDLEAPNLAFVQSFPALTSNSSFAVSGDLEDNVTATGSAVTFTVNGGSSQVATVDPCATAETTQTAFSFTAALIEGENTIVITVADMFGNEREYTRVVTLDTEAEVAITVPSSDTSTKADAYQVKGTAEAGANVTATFAGSDVARFTAASSSETTLANLDLSSKDDGTYVLTVTATDPAGNSSTVTRSITRDTEAGLSGVDYPAIVTDDTATITGSTDDGDSLTATLNGSKTGVTVTQDGTSFSVALTGLSEGDSVVRLISTDDLGNAKSQTVTINYDTDALFTVTDKTPGSDALNGSTYYTTSGALSYTIRANRSGEFILKVNRNGLDRETVVLGAGESQSVTLRGSLPLDGTYSIEVSGTEPGDLNELAFDYAVVIDNADPTVTLSSGLATSVTNATFAISGTITDDDSPIAYYEIYRGDAKVKTVANPESDFTDSVTLASGENILTVMAYDAAGNFARDVHTVTYTASSGGGGGGSSSGGTFVVVEEPVTTEEAIVFESKFTDVEGHWAADAIRLMEERGIANGMTENEFAPEGTITRAQFATLLVRALGLDITAEQSTFADVNADAWYKSYVMAAYRAGLVNGMGDGRFSPEANITREQMAVMIMRAFNTLENADFASMSTDMGQRFQDQTGIAGWAYRAVLIANDMGIINGMTEDTFAPAMNATRAQAIVMLMRLLQSTGDL